MRTRTLLLVLLNAFSCYAAILGLDFGHDFTKAALVAPGVPFEIVMSADSKRKDVSALAFKPLGNDEFERLYGSHTASYCTRFPAQCLNNLKPLMGRSVEDQEVQHYLQSHPGVQVIPSKNNRNTISFNVSGHVYPIEEVFAMSIQNIVARASILLKEKSPGGFSQIKDIAVTVPGFFDSAQRSAVKDAVELAGLNLVSLVDDGLAIAVNYATSREFKESETEYHIIYDMGAGSTKATLVSYKKTDESTPVAVQVEGYSYDPSFGGSHFTNAVADIIKAKFLEKHSSIHTSAFNSNHRAVSKLYQTAEKTKLVLSANGEAHVSIESFYDDIDFKTTISRENFEDFISDSATRVTDPILNVLESTELELKDLKSVIYAGGSTRVPFVQQHLLSVIGEDLVSKTINADEAAVFGATLRGIQISKMFRAKELNVTEPSTFQYVIEFDSGSITEVFPVGTPYGDSVTIDVTDSVSDSEKVSFDVIENGKRYITFDGGKLSDIKSNFKFNLTDCAEDVKYVAKFTLTQSRLLNLDTLEAQCSVSKAGFFDKFRGTEGQEDDSSEKPKVKKSSISTKTKYLGPRPLGSASKQELKNHIATLDMKDKQRKLVSEKLNELEAALYNARALLSDDQIQENIPKVTISESGELVSELLEWLDYESEGAELKEIRNKIDDVQSMTHSLKVYIEELSIPLDAEEFERIHNEGVVHVNSLQDVFMTMGEEALSMSVSFAENGLDFEQESKKLKKLEKVTEADIEDTKARVSATFEVIKKMYTSPKKLDAMDRITKLEIRREGVSRLHEIEKMISQLKTMHTQKMKELKSALNRHIKAQKRAAAKEEAKKASESETSSETHDEL